MDSCCILAPTSTGSIALLYPRSMVLKYSLQEWQTVRYGEATRTWPHLFSDPPAAGTAAVTERMECLEVGLTRRL